MTESRAIHDYAGVLQNMGRRVLVTHKYERQATGPWRYWAAVPLEEPAEGWAVGIRYLQTGIVESGQDEWGYTAYLRETQARSPAGLVVLHPTREPLRVPLPLRLVE